MLQRVSWWEENFLGLPANITGEVLGSVQVTGSFVSNFISTTAISFIKGSFPAPGAITASPVCHQPGLPE